MAERITLNATVISNSLLKAKNKGTPSVTLKFQTHYDVREPSKPYETVLLTNLWLTYKTVERTLKTLKEVFGWEGYRIEELNEPVLRGKEVNLVCEWEEWEGEQRLNVVFVNKPGVLKKSEGPDLDELVNEVQPMIDGILGKASDVEKPVFENGIIVPPESQEDGLPF